MIERRDVQSPLPLTERQQQVAVLVQRYKDAAEEMPSSGWISRRMNISTRRAKDHLEALRRKGWFS